MKTEQIIKLAEAGFTRDEILAMAKAEMTQAAKPAEAPKEEPKAEPVEAPAERPAAERPAANVPSQEDLMRPFTEALESLKETIRVSNINRDSMPEAPEAEDILATILAPNIKK